MSASKSSFLCTDGSLKALPQLRAPQGRKSMRISAFQVRPYTTRKGETIEAIAEKKGFDIDVLTKLNHSTDVTSLEEGAQILLPAEKLSDGDRQIITGIGRQYRTYAVRKGDTLEKILEDRGISMEEFTKLNTDISASAIKPNMILKLPKGKYKARGEVESIGTSTDFYQSNEFLASAGFIGIAFLIGFILWWTSNGTKK